MAPQTTSSRSLKNIDEDQPGVVGVGQSSAPVTPTAAVRSAHTLSSSPSSASQSVVVNTIPEASPTMTIATTSSHDDDEEYSTADDDDGNNNNLLVIQTTQDTTTTMSPLFSEKTHSSGNGRTSRVSCMMSSLTSEGSAESRDRRVNKLLSDENKTYGYLLSNDVNDDNKNEDEEDDDIDDERRRRCNSYRVGRGSRGDIVGVSMHASDFVNMVDDIDLKWYRYGWSVILGIAGFLDMMTLAGPMKIRIIGGCSDFLSWPSNTDFVPSLNDESVFCSIWVPFMRWLETYDVAISFVFSVLWAMRSFMKAKEDRHQFEVRRDRRRLLQPSRGSRHVTVEDRNICGQNDKIPKAFRTIMTPQLVYYRHVLLQCVLLPVGFYVITYNILIKLYYDGKILGLMDELKDTNGTEIVLKVYDEQAGTTEYEVFNERSKLALIFALMKHIYISTLAVTALARVAVIDVIRKKALSYIRPLMKRAIRNPVRFKRRLKALLKYVRYIKYTIPVVGGLNKMKGQVDDLFKKYKQKKIADKQRRVRKLLWKEKSPEMREVDAAILIQSVFRSHRARRYRDALLLVQQDRKAIAAAKIQSQLRRLLAEARVELMQKRRELQLLEQQRKTSPGQLADEDRRRLYQLQDEFAVEAHRIINRKMLLAPNTRFAVVWKVLFVVAIGVEVSQKAVAPWLHERRARRTGKRMTIREFAADSLIPTPVAQHPECIVKPHKTRLPRDLLHRRRRQGDVPKEVQLEDYSSESIPWICYEPFSTWWNGFHDVMALALTPAPMKEWPECQPDHKPTTIRECFSAFFAKKEKNTPPPWHCFEPYATMQTIYRWFVDVLIDDFMIIMSIICFFDVFVTFFTGEVDKVTGELVPKPFFARWIMPGLLIQLLLNPAIDSVSDIVFYGLRNMYTIGPIRVWRWIVAVCLPIVYGLSKVITAMAMQQSQPKDKLVVGYQLKKRK
jgi:IQ calmodulin-binding motif